MHKQRFIDCLYMAVWEGTERDYVMESLGYYGNYDTNEPCWFTVYPFKGEPCIIVAGKCDDGWFAEAIDAEFGSVNTYVASTVNEAVDDLLAYMRREG